MSVKRTDWQIRPMMAADICEVNAVERATPGAPHWSLGNYKSCLREAGGNHQRLAWVAVFEGEILGFGVAGGVMLSTGSEWELESLAVLPKWQRRGVATALMETMIRELQSLGASSLMLEVRTSNGAAIRLYERMELITKGMRKGYYRSAEGNEAEDALLMKLPFKNSGEER